MPVALSDGDLQGMLDFLYTAGEVDGPVAFTEPVIAALRKLIRSDGGGACNVFRGLDASSVPARRTVLDFADVDCDWCVDLKLYWTDAFDEACRLFVARDEPIPPQPQFMLRPTRVSDVQSYREQRANELWWHVGRHFGDDAVWLWLPSPQEGVLRRISFGAERRGGITERDVRILELLTPHLVQLYRRAARRRTVPESTDGLTAREYEVMALAREGKSNKEIAATLWVSPNTVRKHLENVYEKLGVSNRTAAAARLYAPNGGSSGTNGHAAPG
jgi:DNA-binding CsgD family transcriptional regulator